MISINPELMKVEVEGDGYVDLPEGSDISDLVEKLGHHQDSVVVLEDERPLPLDKELKDEEKLKVISVVSGG